MKKFTVGKALAFLETNLGFNPLTQYGPLKLSSVMCEQQKQE